MQDEVRDLWRNIARAKCPKCQKSGLRLLDAGSDRLRASGATSGGQSEPPDIATCAYCAGYWVQRGDKEIVVEEPAEELEPVPEHNPAADLKAGLCPFGHGILIRARVPLEPGFFLDRCMKCGGIWFDRGEFERLAIASFFEELPLLWNLSYQRETRQREREEREERWLAGNLGEELLASVRAVGKALRGHPFRNAAIALIREESERRKRDEPCLAGKAEPGGQEVTSAEVTARVQAELERGESFGSFHGLTPENVREFLVPPQQVAVDPDDLETMTRPMWLVLQLMTDPTMGYSIAWDPDQSSWAVIEHVRADRYIQIVAGSTLAEALDGM